MQVLPDVLRNDRNKPAAYLNGRVLADDVYSMRFCLADPWQGSAERPEAAQRPAVRFPVPRRAEPHAGGYSLLIRTDVTA
jgi:hypothetical protein